MMLDWLEEGCVQYVINISERAGINCLRQWSPVFSVFCHLCRWRKLALRHGGNCSAPLRRRRSRLSSTLPVWTVKLLSAWTAIILVTSLSTVYWLPRSLAAKTAVVSRMACSFPGEVPRMHPIQTVLVLRRLTTSPGLAMRAELKPTHTRYT